MSVEELYELRIAAFEQWSDAGLNIFKTPVEQFRRYIKDKTVFVAQDEATGELLGMRTLTLNNQKGRAAESNLSVASKAKRQGIATKLINYEVEWLKKNGYRYTTCSTAIPATWSVQWHLKNGYRIVGYSRSEKQNYARYCLTWMATMICKDNSGRLNWLGRMAKRSLRH